MHLKFTTDRDSVIDSYLYPFCTLEVIYQSSVIFHIQKFHPIVLIALSPRARENAS